MKPEIILNVIFVKMLPLLMIFSLNVTLAQDTWKKTFGGSDAEGAASLQPTSDGGYILAGVTDSYGKGNYDFWLIKTDEDGEKIWDKTYGGIEQDGASSVQPTSDGGYIVAGYTESYGEGEDDVWLIKTDEQGNEIISDPSGSDNSGKQKLAFNAYPDPTHSGYHIQLSPALKSKINGNHNVSLRIYSTQGRMVQEISGESMLDKNSESFYWDGIDSKGNELNAGYYLLTVSVGSRTLSTTKIVLAR